MSAGSSCCIAAVAVLVAGWWGAAPQATPGTDPFAVRVPAGLPPVTAPPENPITAAKVALGEKLFFNRRLSADGTISCASCHLPDRFFADGARLSTGVAGQLGDHNTPSILNAAYAPHLLWDGRSRSLEDQVRYPVTHPREMSTTESRVVQTLREDPAYQRLFAQAFDAGPITWTRVTAAIASFERTLLSGNAPFDRYVVGESQALTPGARRGYALFMGSAGCAACHVYSAQQPFFSDFDFHNTGAGWSDPPNLGRFNVTKAREDKGTFRTPSLRNVAVTGPYMHDGGMSSLREVVDFYARGGKPNPFLDARLKPLALTEDEKEALVEFLEALTGESTYPAAPRGPVAAGQEPRVPRSLDRGPRPFIGRWPGARAGVLPWWVRAAPVGL